MDKCFPLIDIKSHFKEKLAFTNLEINIISLKCLLTKEQIITPVRGFECHHLESYEESALKKYLLNNKSLICIKCQKFINAENIIYDNFLFAIIKYNKYNNQSIKIKKSLGTWAFVQEEESIKNSIIDESYLFEYFKYYNDENYKSELILLYPILQQNKFKMDIIFPKILKNKNLCVISTINFSSITNKVFLNRNFLNAHVNFLQLITNTNESIYYLEEIFLYFNFIIDFSSFVVLKIDNAGLNFFKNVYGTNYLYLIVLMKKLLLSTGIMHYIYIFTDDKFEAVNIQEYFINLNRIRNESINVDICFNEFEEKLLLDSINFDIESSYKFSEVSDINWELLFQIITFDHNITFTQEEILNFTDDYFHTSLKTHNYKINNSIQIFHEVKYLITNNLSFLTNFSEQMGSDSYYPIEIDESSFANFKICNTVNYDLISQFLHVIAHRNFFLTNCPDYNAQLSIKILNKENLKEFLNFKTPTNKIKIFFIFLEDLNTIDLDNMIGNKNLTKCYDNMIDSSNIISIYEDETFLKYFFFHEKENSLSILIIDDIEHIVNYALKLKTNAINYFMIRDISNIFQ